MTIRILFVDDDANLLQGLRRALGRMRNEWELVFVDGGAKALEAFRREPFDVVVSDLRMPQMDGAKLQNLHEIRRFKEPVKLIRFSDTQQTEDSHRAPRAARI